MSDVFAVSGSSTRLDRVLHDLLRRAPELEAASVVSFDGLPMASALPPGFDEDRVAAMSAALLSLGERASQGLGRGSLNQVYVEGEEGTVFLVSCDDEAVLVAVGAHGAKVGLLLFEVRRGALAVAETLRHEELPEPQGYIGRDLTAPLPVHVAGHEVEPFVPLAAPVEVFEAAPVVEVAAEAVVEESFTTPVHMPSYSNLPMTPAYATYDGVSDDDESLDDEAPVPMGDVAVPVGEISESTYVEDPYTTPVYAAEAAEVEAEAEQLYAAIEPSSELGSWATFTPGGSLSAPNGQGLDPWI
jgi:predicted regulator of Ras-like GTPase activity (Roadblock/LC7/MglB family)